MNKVESELSIYLQHSIGAALGFAGVCLFIVLLIENQPVLNGGKSLALDSFKLSYP